MIGLGELLTTGRACSISSEGCSANPNLHPSHSLKALCILGIAITSDKKGRYIAITLINGCPVALRIYACIDRGVHLACAVWIPSRIRNHANQRLVYHDEMGLEYRKPPCSQYHILVLNWPTCRTQRVCTTLRNVDVILTPPFSGLFRADQSGNEGLWAGGDGGEVEGWGEWGLGGMGRRMGGCGT